MHKIGQEITVKVGNGFKGSASYHEISGKVASIEITSIKLGVIFSAYNNKDLNNILDCYKDNISTVRYGIYINDSLLYFFEHEVV